MSFFSSPPFLEVLASVYFRGRDTRVARFGVKESVFRLLEVDGRPIAAWPFLDFVEPLAQAETPHPEARPLDYLPKACLGTVPAPAWQSQGLASRFEPSPFVDFRGLPSWADFEALVRSRRSSLWADSRRQARKLEAEAGGLAFNFQDPRPEVLETCLRWKSAQYLASGFPDHFAVPGHARLFRELAGAGLLTVSSLSAGDTLAAAHIGVVYEGRFCYWIPAYEARLGGFSPGRLLLEFLLQESQARGLFEFDFLIGDEPYKWLYATHTRLIGPLGRPPLSVRLLRGVRASVKRLLSWSPRALALARRLKRRWGSRPRPGRTGPGKLSGCGTG